MLKYKDYCDSELTTLLQEVGMPIKNVVATSPHGATKWYSNVTLYEAQKWLREEKFLLIVVDRLLNGEYVFSIVDILNYSQEKDGTANSYEEALSEGIKEAVKILKEE